MNYYERHIGDYLKDTAHLTLLEHGVYTRLLDVYYTREGPIPAKEAARLIGARDKDEREALQMVLAEFFTESPEGWRQKRCDEEIARFHEGDDDRARRESNERERVRKHREDRARMFDALRAVGQTPKWNIATDALRDLVKRYCNGSVPPPDTPPATEPVTPPVTEPVTLATATHYPVPSTQYPEQQARTASQEERPPDEGTPLRALPAFQNLDPEPRDAPTPPDPTRAGQVSKLLRDQGVLCTPSNPILLGWLELGLTDREFLDAVATARFQKPKPEQIPIRYLDPIVREMRTKPKANGSHGGEKWWESEQSINRKASELGMQARSGEGWNEFKDRIRQRIAEGGKAA